jgi:hypothetical protein
MAQFLMGRRRWLASTGAAAVLTLAGGRPARSADAVDVPVAGYRYLPGNPVYAVGAVTLPGFEVVHALLDDWLPLDAGYAAVEAHLQSVGRPMQALCGMELRLPRQLSLDEFRAFNAPYVERLVRWGLLGQGSNPVSRTNVAPALEPPEAPALHGFSYCVPSAGAAGGDFVMSGMTESGPGGIVAPGDVSPAGLRAKLDFLVRAVDQRITSLGVSLATPAQVDLYAAQPMEGLLAELLLPAIDRSARRGLRWHYGRPPVTGAELELEARRFSREIVVHA